MRIRCIKDRVKRRNDAALTRSPVLDRGVQATAVRLTNTTALPLLTGPNRFADRPGLRPGPPLQSWAGGARLIGASAGFRCQGGGHGHECDDGPDARPANRRNRAAARPRRPRLAAVAAADRPAAPRRDNHQPARCRAAARRRFCHSGRGQPRLRATCHRLPARAGAGRVVPGWRGGTGDLAACRLRLGRALVAGRVRRPGHGHD